MPLLHPGDPFPELSLTVPGGATVKVPETFDGQFGAMLFYRGSWCPCCNVQLRAFQRAIADLTGAFVNPDPVYLQSTGFVLDPQGKVVVSVYSSGPSAISSPRMSPGWSATCTSTPPRRHSPAGAAGETVKPPPVRDMPLFPERTVVTPSVTR